MRECQRSLDSRRDDAQYKSESSRAQRKRFASGAEENNSLSVTNSKFPSRFPPAAFTTVL